MGVAGLRRDQAIVEKVRPEHWPAEVWEFHLAERTRKLVVTGEFRRAFHDG
jgi:hypothetical protein